MRRPECPINAKATCFDSVEETPLINAIFLDRESVALALLEHAGVDVNLSNSAHYTPIRLFFFTKSVDILKGLLARDEVEVNRPKNFGERPVHLAVRRGTLEQLQCLLNSGKKKRVEVNVLDEDGDKPLHGAANLGDVEKVRCLLRNSNTSCNVKNSLGNTAKDLAAQAGHHRIADLLSCNTTES